MPRSMGRFRATKDVRSYGVSERAVGYSAFFAGVAAGYILRLVLLKFFGIAMASAGYTQIFGQVPLLVVASLTVIALFASAYLAARYSHTLPMLNGVAGAILGVVTFASFGSINGMAVFAVVVCFALAFGYLGAYM